MQGEGVKNDLPKDFFSILSIRILRMHAEQLKSWIDLGWARNLWDDNNNVDALNAHVGTSDTVYETIYANE